MSGFELPPIDGRFRSGESGRLRDVIGSSPTVVFVVVRESEHNLDASARRRLKKVFADRPDTRGFVIDLDSAPGVARELAVYNVPTVRVYHKGLAVRQYHGSVDPGELGRCLDEVGAT